MSCWPGQRKVGYINKQGHFIIPVKFNDARSFSSGLAAVKIGSLWGYIDKAGKIAIAPKLDQAFDFYNGLATVVVDNKYGYTDTKGASFLIPKNKKLGVLAPLRLSY